MIDLHSHILPGIDDGARDLEEAVTMARDAVAGGIVANVATPHVREDYPTRASTMEEQVDALRRALVDARVELQILPGGELDLAHVRGLDEAELRRFALGGGSWLLLEFPYAGWPLGLAATASELASCGLASMLAHPERNAEVQERPTRLEVFVEAGMLVQLTAAAVDGRLGRRSRETAFALLELGLAHVIATDSHSPTMRQGGMSAASKAVGDPELAWWLTAGVPSAIIRDEPLPDRPEPRRRRFSLARRR